MLNHLEYRVDANTRPYQSKMEGLKKTTSAASAKLVKEFKGIGAGIAAAFSIGAARSVLNFADNLSTMSATLGVSAEFIQRWQEANLKNGIAIQASTVALQRFTRRSAEADNGTGVLAKTFERLGISTRNANGTLKSTETLLMEFSEALSGNISDQERLALAFSAFDTEGAKIVSTIKGGAGELKNLLDSANVLTDDQVDKLAAANVAIAAMQRDAQIVGGGLLANVAEGWAGVKRWAKTIGTDTGTIDSISTLFFDPDRASSGVKRLEKMLADQLEARETGARRALEREKEITEEKEKQAKLAAKEKEKFDALVQKEFDRLDSIKAQLAARKEALAASEADLIDRRTGFTVSGSAGGGLDSMIAEFGLNATGRQNLANINEISRLERFARAARFNGRADLMNQALSRADELRAATAPLIDSERNPFSSIDSTLKEIQTAEAGFYEEVRNVGVKLRT